MSTNQTTLTKNQTTISKDAGNKKLFVVREFDAPLEEVWEAWTKSNILDQWWAPKPWKAKTKSMNFKEGGAWLYSMVGPDASEQFCRFDFEKIIPQNYFTGQDAFCDEQGNVTHDFPVMHWKNNFSTTGNGTRVTVDITFASEADMMKIIEMGFEQGFTAAHGNLDELLKK